MRAIEDGRVTDTEMSDFYLDECVGCLACETACPANVPYGDILAEKRSARNNQGKKADFRIALAAKLVMHRSLFQLIGFPVRLMRRLGINLHKLLVPGKPSLILSTADHAKKQVEKYMPKGKKVTLLTGCLMESTYREINFATVNVLVKLGYQVEIPKDQACCGAIHEHAGLPGKAELDQRNITAFNSTDAEIILTNSAGCGLALKHGAEKPVEDIVSFLSREKITARRKSDIDQVFVDQPCHLVNGQKVTVPISLMDSLGIPWSFAPRSDECCGAGGTYNVTHEENSEKILQRKSGFLKEAAFSKMVLATANHVCMQQWNKGIAMEGVSSRASVKHIIQLVDEVL
jgi:glycolate oxidase iron-sulfur subunit